MYHVVCNTLDPLPSLLFLDRILSNCLKVSRLDIRGDLILLEYSQLLRFSQTPFTYGITTVSPPV